ncbi:MAG: radical SAM family heme chaperone HemW [Gammaproteobacteria bacterium]|nr:radical SAM family heme chaperone HemW [Gammaproteobacteria bacterium]
MFKNNSIIPLSLYIHLPWCARKCPYCDFNSHAAPQHIPEHAYIEQLIKDLEQQLPYIRGRRLVSIFLGGGTPSLFSPQAIEKLLSAIYSRLRFAPDTEITLEANPGTVDESRFKGFRAAGINRLSIGIQSLQDKKLQALGRIHNRENALRAIEASVNAGFDNFNLDLMHGLPQQTLDDAISDIQDALQFKPPHLSWYQLTIEPNTFFHHHPPPLPEDDVLWEIQEKGKHILHKEQLLQYEVSAYAKENYKCKHNLNYWEFGDYLGIGAGAHSKITNTEDQTISRHWQVKNPKDYLNPKTTLTSQRITLAKHDIIFEFMLNALRLTSGVSMDLFTARTGLSSDVLEPILTEVKTRKLLVDNPSFLRATELGQRFLNNVIEYFLPALKK